MTRQQQQHHARHIARCHYFCSGHVLMNSERQKRNLPTLKRSHSLDQSARKHALQMAQECKVQPIANSVEELQEQLGNCTTRKVAQHVSHGFSVRRVHHVQMTNKVKTDYADNVLNKRFTHVGFGSARGEDGKIYIVQLFRGKNTGMDRVVRHLFGVER